MTGEITLSGQVLPVAGLKEKVAGACRRGLTRLVLPRQNEEQFQRGPTATSGVQREPYDTHDPPAGRRPRWRLNLGLRAGRP